MAPYELNSVGGSVEYMNDEAGNVWLQRLRNHFEKTGIVELTRRSLLALHPYDWFDY